jgi:hypothetical protein
MCERVEHTVELCNQIGKMHGPDEGEVTSIGLEQSLLLLVDYFSRQPVSQCQSGIATIASACAVATRHLVTQHHQTNSVRMMECSAMWCGAVRCNTVDLLRTRLLLLRTAICIDPFRHLLVCRVFWSGGTYLNVQDYRNEAFRSSVRLR